MRMDATRERVCAYGLQFLPASVGFGTAFISSRSGRRPRLTEQDRGRPAARRQRQEGGEREQTSDVDDDGLVARGQIRADLFWEQQRWGRLQRTGNHCTISAGSVKGCLQPNQLRQNYSFFCRLSPTDIVRRKSRLYDFLILQESKVLFTPPRRECLREIEALGRHGSLLPCGLGGLLAFAFRR